MKVYKVTKMKKIFENEHPLVTPNFIGTDKEKTEVLCYWASLVSVLRNMNDIVISFDNKLAIISQLQSELALMDNEVNNDSARPVVHNDGSTNMTNTPPNQTVGEPPKIVDLTSQEDIYKIPVAEQMQRIAGIWYSSNNKNKK